MQKSLVSRTEVGRGLVVDPPPRCAAGQELEMVDQGSQVVQTLGVAKLHTECPNTASLGA